MTERLAVINEGYNGWKNYETWLVGLWLDNDERLYHESQRIARRAKDRYEAGQEFKAWIEDMSPLADSADLFTDLINAALSEVDWYEVADHFTGPNEDEESEDDEDE
jgi:hypothetical protein